MEADSFLSAPRVPRDRPRTKRGSVMSPLYAFGRSTDFPHHKVVLDRTAHTFLIGATGTGKTTVMLPMVKHDLYAGNSVILMEPHGTFAEQVLKHIPPWRTNMVAIINPSSPDAVGFNPLGILDREKAVDNVIDAMLGVFNTKNNIAIGDRSQYILRNYLVALCETKTAPSLLFLPRMLSDWEYAKTILEASPSVRRFYEAFSKQPNRERVQALAPLQNKLDKLMGNRYSRVIFGHPKPIDIGDMMNNGGIIIVRMSKGEVGEETCQFILSMLLSMVKTATFEREKIPYDKRKWCSIYIDEFANCAKGHTIDSVLAESRKYKTAYTIAIQYTEQLSEGSMASITSNVGNMLTSRINDVDALAIGSLVGLNNPKELTKLKRGEWYVRPSVEGDVLQVRKVRFKSKVGERGSKRVAYEVLKQSKRRYSMPRAKVLQSADSF